MLTEKERKEKVKALAVQTVEMLEQQGLTLHEASEFSRLVSNMIIDSNSKTQRLTSFKHRYPDDA